MQTTLNKADDNARACANLAKHKYRSNASTLAEWHLGINGILIALAAASAGTLIYGSNTDVIKGIGLGAATLGGYNSYLFPGSARAQYRRSQTAASCVYNEIGSVEQAAGHQVDSTSKSQLAADYDVLNTYIKNHPNDKTNFPALYQQLNNARELGRTALNEYYGLAFISVKVLYKIDIITESNILSKQPSIQSVIDQIKATTQAQAAATAQQNKSLNKISIALHEIMWNDNKHGGEHTKTEEIANTAKAVTKMATDVKSEVQSLAQCAAKAG